MRDYTGHILKAYDKLHFTPRDNQVEIINNIINSFIEEEYTNVILCAGTGHGKSLIAMVVQLVLKELNQDENYSEKANIIMNTNVLIDQYNNSFNHLPKKEFYFRKGANNYTCDLLTERMGQQHLGEDWKESAEMCISECDKNCKFANVCKFNIDKKLQRSSKCVISNYSYWMSANLFGRNKESILLNVFDECHTMNDVFSSFASVEITTKLVDSLLKIYSYLQESGSEDKDKFPKEELEALKNSIKAIEIKDEFDFSQYKKLTEEQKLKISQSINNENYEHFINTINAISPLLERIKDITFNEKDILERMIKSAQEKVAAINLKHKERKEELEHKKKRADEVGFSEDEEKELATIRKEIKDQNILLNQVTEVYSKIAKGYNRVSNILYQIELIKDDNEILFEKIQTEDEEGIRATPVFIKKYWSVMNNSKYNLFMSATVTKEYVERTIDLEGDTKFIFVPSTFPKENKLIVNYKQQRLNYASMKDPEVIENILKSCEDIVEANNDVNGIILTTTFDLTKKVAERIRQNSKYVKVFEHKQKEKIADILEKFKSTDEVSVLISPSLWEGISLDDDKSRYQIVCKTPYGSLASKRNKYIQVRLPEIYKQQTLLTLIQGFGRSVRNKDDFCVTYCLDSYTNDEIQRYYNVWKNDYTYQTIN